MFRELAVLALAVGLIANAARAQERDAKLPVVVSDVAQIIATSESGKTLYGYSVKTGTWESLAITNAGNIPLDPVLGSGVAYVAIDRKIHAFCATTGHWATLELPEVARAEVYPGSLHVRSGTRFHVFSGVTGKWATVDLAVDKQ